MLDAHEEIEAKLGPLHLINRAPRIQYLQGIELAAWALVYESRDGIREIRRHRISTAHADPNDSDMLWAITAAKVSADLPGDIAPTRIRVVEIGGVDGSSSVLFDDSPSTATATFEEIGRPQAQQTTQGGARVNPCRECSSCKVAGICEALPNVTGMLGQSGPGFEFRSVSPMELSAYRQCPAQWFLDHMNKLPKEKGETEAQARGRVVHDWIAKAHSRGVACQLEDLPSPDGDIGSIAEVLSLEDYTAAYPFLVQHVARCPLGDPGIRVRTIEESVYGLDLAAQVIAATKPDMLYSRGDRLVAREVKTSTDFPAQGRDEAYSQNLQIPFLLTMITNGLSAWYGATAGTVELEWLTPDGSEVWSWDSDHQLTVRVAQGDIRREADAWHNDRAWNSRPGPHCTWCPVREWCPDKDKQSIRSPLTDATATVNPLAGQMGHDLPPF
ncbi:PD-(D/E)XK nuclease family protein [Sphaerisporangium sp. NPDC051017]|uniref:PD-(D/E)XK nuclease family protein n=1 Tax=Sphaerisporangium sp. NPDC051017 TaxID=3154636 RepID=UPI00344AF801